jgi:AAA domain
MDTDALYARGQHTGGYLEYPSAFPRSPVDKIMEEEIPPPQMLVGKVLYFGRTHHLFAPGGKGKSWIGLILSMGVMKRGYRVAYFDFENGVSIIGERLQCLDVPQETARDLLYYSPYPSMVGAGEFGRPGKTLFKEFLEKELPALIIWDSWAAALERCGIDESDNTGVENWCSNYLDPAKKMGIASLVMDHQPHGNNRAIGAIRKVNAIDVQWRLKSNKAFDRNTIGKVTLQKMKDRHGRLPEESRFELGGTPFHLKFTVSKGDLRKDPEKENHRGRANSIVQDLIDNGPANAELISERTGMHLKTVRNKISDSLNEGSIIEVGTEGGSRIVDVVR